MVFTLCQPAGNCIFLKFFKHKSNFLEGETILTGFEPGIPSLGGRCLIRWATEALVGRKIKYLCTKTYKKYRVQILIEKLKIFQI